MSIKYLEQVVFNWLNIPQFEQQPQANIHEGTPLRKLNDSYWPADNY